jgi:toxin ParE1/3/4
VRVELHPEREVELHEAAVWYDDKSPGLGDELLEEVSRWLDLIAEVPSAWPEWPGAPNLDPPIRRGLTTQFSYAIAYRAYPRQVSILAFAHTSRRPFYWTQRIHG